MRHQEFDRLVKSSLYEVAHQLELAEAKRYLEEDIQEMERNSNFGNLSIDGFYSQTFSFQNGTFSFSQTLQPPAQSPNSSIQTPSVPNTQPTMPSLQVPRPQNDSNSELSERSRAPIAALKNEKGNLRAFFEIDNEGSGITLSVVVEEDSRYPHIDIGFHDGLNLGTNDDAASDDDIEDIDVDDIDMGDYYDDI